MTIDTENHETIHKPAPAPSKAFPENREPRGQQHFGPAPRPPRPSVENPLNTDKFGTRRPWDR